MSLLLIDFFSYLSKKRRNCCIRYHLCISVSRQDRGWEKGTFLIVLNTPRHLIASHIAPRTGYARIPKTDQRFQKAPLMHYISLQQSQLLCKFSLLLVDCVSTRECGPPWSQAPAGRLTARSSWTRTFHDLLGAMAIPPDTRLVFVLPVIKLSRISPTLD